MYSIYEIQYVKVTKDDDLNISLNYRLLKERKRKSTDIEREKAKKRNSYCNVTCSYLL